MGLFDAFFGKSTNAETSKTNTDSPTSSFVNSTQANVKIDEETALKIASLQQGINIIGDTIASMPILLYKNNEGFNEVFDRDPRSYALSYMSNEVMSAFNMKKNLIKDVILYGNAYAKIVREGESVKLYYLPKSIITPKKDNAGYYYEVQSYSTDVAGESYPAEQVDDLDMVTLIRGNKYNSVSGKGLLDYGKDVLGIAVEESTYMLNLFRNGLSSKAILSSKTPFRKEVKEQLKKDLRDFYSGSTNAGKIMVLEGDIDVVPLALTPTDIRLIENRNFSISEIARFLNIQKHLLNLDRQQGTYSNVTSERMMLLQNTLMPYVTLIEQALNSKLLTPEEIEQGYYFQFDTSELLKLTPQDQANFMLDLYRENIVTIEEVRETLNLGGDGETIAELKALQDAKHNSAMLQLQQQGEELKKKTKEQPVEEEETDTKEEDSSKEVKKPDESKK